jgi:hypothetical protein
MKKVAISSDGGNSRIKFTETDIRNSGSASVQCLTEGQTAGILRCSRALLRKWRRSKADGPRFYKFGRLVRYSVEDLQAWLEAHRANEYEKK